MSEIKGDSRKSIRSKIEESWGSERYTLYNVKEDWRYPNKFYTFSFNSIPPLCYESGLGALSIENGQAMTVTYVSFTQRASRLSYLKQDNTASTIGYVFFYDRPPVYGMTLQKTPCVDLVPGGDWIVNAHTGTLTLSGTSEENALITFSAGGQTATATAGKNGAYSLSAPLELDGRQEYTLTASLKGRPDNSFSAVLPIDNSVAALTLTQYPYGEIYTDEEIIVCGKVSAAAQVTVSLDGGEAAAAPVTDGTFHYTCQAEPWRVHDLVITVSEEGKTPCTAETSFYVQYENIDKGLKAFRQQAAKLNCKQLANAPAEHVGELVKMEFYTRDLQHTPSGLAFEANGLLDNKKYPMILLADGYINDMITEGMYITAYGVVSEPTLTEDPIPRIQLVYVTYQKKTYK